MASGKRTSFVVRVLENGQGQVSGVIERVATGAKEAFAGLEVIGPVIQRMLRHAARVQARPLRQFGVGQLARRPARAAGRPPDPPDRGDRPPRPRVDGSPRARRP